MIEPLLEFRIGSPVRQLRAVLYENKGRKGFIFAHADSPEDQPAIPGDFFWPKDTLKISAFTLNGEEIWRHDVGRGVVAGNWFCPVFPFDLDGDGADEIYHVGNADEAHPFSLSAMELVALSGTDGRVLSRARWPWFSGTQSASDTFRYFINGGYSRGKPVLVTMQGTYHEITVHGWRGDLTLAWERRIQTHDPGCRASHMFPVLDIDGDGRDEIFVGERCIDIDTGADKWVADREGYNGHSDVVMPTLDRESQQWRLYTCREFGYAPEARGVVMFDGCGREQWGHRGMGHMHSGWTARLGEDGSHRCYAMEILKDKRTKTITTRQFLYDMDGKPLEIPFDLRGSNPVDIDGDGRHEVLIRDNYPFNVSGGIEDRVGLVVDRHGQELGRLRGSAGNLIRSKVLDCPGEQIMTREGDTVRIYGCPGAKDRPEAKARYAHPYYRASQRLTSVGYNWRNLGGL